jgi:hypothetical protein
MFPVVFATFMTCVQLGYLEVGAMTTDHAAVEAARAASVILADDPKFYDSPVGVASGKRVTDVLESARVPLRVTARNPNVRVKFPDRTTFKQGDQVRVEVELDFPCTISLGRWLVCGAKSKRTIKREATMPYQGAGYVYP